MSLSFQPSFYGQGPSVCDTSDFSLQLAKYMKLDQKGKVLAEYIWIDGTNGLRNKTKVSDKTSHSCVSLSIVMVDSASGGSQGQRPAMPRPVQHYRLSTIHRHDKQPASVWWMIHVGDPGPCGASPSVWLSGSIHPGADVAPPTFVANNPESADLRQFGCDVDDPAPTLLMAA